MKATEGIPQTIFREQLKGVVMAEQVVRNREYSMTSRHFHDTYELYCLLEGESYYFIDRETYPVTAGDVVLVKPAQIHKTSMMKNSRQNRLLLQITEEGFDPFLRANDFPTLKELYDRSGCIIRLRREDRDTVEKLMTGIGQEIRGRKRNCELMVKLKLLELMILLSRYGESLLPEGGKLTAQTSKHRKVHQVAEYLQNHPETGESLEELARRFYISRSYLSRIFKEVTGFSVTEYVNIVRIRKARNLLIRGTYSVTEVSELSGFESITYFERVFKKYTDCTPLKYRKEKRE